VTSASRPTATLPFTRSQAKPASGRPPGPARTAGPAGLDDREPFLPEGVARGKSGDNAASPLPAVGVFDHDCVAATALLVAHLVIAAGIAAGAVMVVRAAEKNSRERLLALTAAVIVAVTIGAGVLTLATKSNWWSYLMAVGFLGGFLAYGALLGGRKRDRVS
jgi:hypothetical protein